jgi:hypothetical protein
MNHIHRSSEAVGPRLKSTMLPSTRRAIRSSRFHNLFYPLAICTVEAIVQAQQDHRIA